MTRRSALQILLVAALAVSIVANFFMLGFLIKGGRSGISGGAVAEAIVRDYPPEVRAEFRRLLRGNRVNTFQALRELRQARRALADAVAAEPYAEDDVKDALARVRVATEALQEMMQRLLLEALRNTRTAA